MTLLNKFKNEQNRQLQIQAQLAEQSYEAFNGIIYFFNFFKKGSPFTYEQGNVRKNKTNARFSHRVVRR